MAITYRRLTDEDLDAFIEMRIRQLREEGATEDIDLAPALKDYGISLLFALLLGLWAYGIAKKNGKEIIFYL